MGGKASGVALLITEVLCSSLTPHMSERYSAAQRYHGCREWVSSGQG